jgi:hypothetical protein
MSVARPARLERGDALRDLLLGDAVALREEVLPGEHASVIDLRRAGMSTTCLRRGSFARSRFDLLPLRSFVSTSTTGASAVVDDVLHLLGEQVV